MMSYYRVYWSEAKRGGKSKIKCNLFGIDALVYLIFLGK